MNYRKLQNSRLSNRILEYRYLKNKSLNEGTNFTMNDKEIIKIVDGKPEDLTDEEKKEIQYIKTTDDKRILDAVKILNAKFGIS
jgi:hypothetical protein